MAEAMSMYAQLAGVKVSKISTGMLGLLGSLTFNKEWKGLATLMTHHDKYGEDGSAEEANRLPGVPRITLKEWREKKHP